MSGFESKHGAAAEMALEWLIVQASLIGCWEELRRQHARHTKTVIQIDLD